MGRCPSRAGSPSSFRRSVAAGYPEACLLRGTGWTNGNAPGRTSGRCRRRSRHCCRNRLATLLHDTAVQPDREADRVDGERLGIGPEPGTRRMPCEGWRRVVEARLGHDRLHVFSVPGPARTAATGLLRMAMACLQEACRASAELPEMHGPIVQIDYSDVDWSSRLGDAGLHMPRSGPGGSLVPLS